MFQGLTHKALMVNSKLRISQMVLIKFWWILNKTKANKEGKGLYREKEVGRGRI